MPAIVRHIVGLLALFLLLAGAPLFAANAQSAGPDPVPPKAAELLQLLEDPEVREWLVRQQRHKKEPDQPTITEAESTVSAMLATRAAVIREHFASLVTALPTLPDELRRVTAIPVEELQKSGAGPVSLHLAVLLALGIGAEWLFRRFTTSGLARIYSLTPDTVSERLWALAGRFALLLGRVIVFTSACGGAFFLFEWPSVLRWIVLDYLLALIALRIQGVVVQFLLAPVNDPTNTGEERLRVVPMDNDAARFWAVRLGAFTAWFVFGLATVDLLDSLGLSPPHRRLVAYALGLGLLAIALEIAWRRPQPAAYGTPAGTDIGVSRRTTRAAPWLLSAYFLLLWLSWVTYALNLFWFASIGGALLFMIHVIHRSVPHVLRPPDTTERATGQPSIGAVCLERGLRAALLIGAIFLLAYKWNVDLVALTTSDTLFVRLVRGVLGAIVVSLLANFAWNVVKAAIEQKLIETSISGPPDAEGARRRARLRTLLPILRTVTLVVLVAMAAMMALASLGIEIGPLIAGAGVVGLALGFGAQTLVRDVISGMFYLLDDAFRVGEYIESGNYKGTVESFSLRTVRLRHHRGPLYTVPFSVLGAIKNMSRDWVIDKLTVTIDYNTDLDKVRKLIKQVGKELVANPEFASIILEPLKMQGVEQFGDYGIQIRMKMMTRPGEQFVIRRKAYSLIKKAFDENGIRFAFPTVQVAGESTPSSAAVAHQGLELVQIAKSKHGST